MENKKNQAFILLGSNLGKREENLTKAIIAIEKFAIVSLKSSLYKTEPWQMNDADWFLNQVILIDTELEANDLLAVLIKIEAELGRTRGNNIGVYESRTIDLDILYFNDLTLDSELLQIPHPRLHLRKFTLLPLVEIAGDHVHPTLNESNEQLLAACGDESEVSTLVLL
ncbi:MAG: 2-amino-4-hydroxy-6-hydroxymethyldihydropteridine diphosphokinase [Salibacteraceae bacterium]|nr:2-amino-4-hydroxy-6-hydroxymethyldihydropteridine diphosphokinase [Salibacteraceae bacterium]